MKLSRKYLKILAVGLAVVCIPIGAAVLVVFVIDPVKSTSQANQKLNSLIAHEGNISGHNSSSVIYRSKRIKGAVKTQRALATGAIPSLPGEFVFTNGKNSRATSINTLKVYIDFSTRQGQEFSLIEQNYIKSLVDFGQIKLIVYSVPSDSSYSIYAPELLAETFAHDPKDAWRVFISLMQLSTQLTDQPQSNNSVVSLLVQIAADEGVKGINRQSILRGEYSSWIFAAGHNNSLNGSKLPLVQLNGKAIAITSRSFYSQNGLERYVSGHLR